MWQCFFLLQILIISLNNFASIMPYLALIVFKLFVIDFMSHLAPKWLGQPLFSWYNTKSLLNTNICSYTNLLFEIQEICKSLIGTDTDVFYWFHMNHQHENVLLLNASLDILRQMLKVLAPKIPNLVKKNKNNHFIKACSVKK